MKPSPRSLSACFPRLRAAFTALALLLPALASGQGQLTPPGPAFPYPGERALNGALSPIPSMKTLMHIDAGEHIPSRDPSKTNLDGSLGYYDLNAPGRYYLTENLSKRIVISSENVTLDLGGFEIRYTGVAPGPTAISASSVLGYKHRTKVINGRIRGAWQIGIDLGEDSVVSGVDVSQAQSYGIKIGRHGLIEDCRMRGPWAQSAPGDPPAPTGPHSGIYGGEATVIARCTATAIGGIGIQVDNSGRIVDCTVSNVAGCGIVSMHGCSVAGCAVKSCGSTGIDLGMSCALTNSTVVGCRDYGVHIRSGTSLSNVTSRENDGAGFYGEEFRVVDSQYFQAAVNFFHCVAQTNQKDGFICKVEAIFDNCIADDNGDLKYPGSGWGIYTQSGSRVTNCVSSNNTLSGISCSQRCTIDGCTAKDNARFGVECSIYNVVIRNTFNGNAMGSLSNSGGGIGPVQTVSTATSPFANFEP